MGNSEVDKCHPRTHVREQLNLEKEFGKRVGEGRGERSGMKGEDRGGKR